MEPTENENKAAGAPSGLNVGLDLLFTPEPQPSHAELLTLIGEIDGIDLESEGYGVAVYLRIGAMRLKIIQDGGENISHHITRTGIACCIGRANVEVSGRPHLDTIKES